MSVKPPASDDVTRPVGGPGLARLHPPELPVEARPLASPPPPPPQIEAPDDGKTTLVNPDEVEVRRPTADEGARQVPQPRLSWPARDQISSPPAREHGLPLTPPDDRTRLFRTPKSTSGAPDGEAAKAETPDADSLSENDPTVGWLVVMEGPGRGRSLELGIGANSIGREKNQKICLRFGDQEVHRERHALVIFDPKSRRFYVQSGEVRNLTYVDDELVLNPVEIKGGEMIVVGRTRMKFVPFCGPDFGW